VVPPPGGGRHLVEAGASELSHERVDHVLEDLPLRSQLWDLMRGFSVY